MKKPEQVYCSGFCMYAVVASHFVVYPDHVQFEHAGNGVVNANYHPAPVSLLLFNSRSGLLYGFGLNGFFFCGGRHGEQAAGEEEQPKDPFFSYW